MVVDNLAGEASPCLHYLREFCTVQELEGLKKLFVLWDSGMSAFQGL